MEMKRFLLFTAVAFSAIEAVNSENVTTAAPSNASTTAPPTSTPMLDQNMTTALPTTTAASPTTTTKPPPLPFTPSSTPPSTSTTTPPPTTTSPPTKATTTTLAPSQKSEITLSIKITSIDNEDQILNNEAEKMKFKKKFIVEVRVLILKRNKNIIIIDITIIKISKGSIVVEFSTVIQGTSRSDVQDVVKTVEDEKNSGKFGNYTVDSSHPTNAKITVTADQFTDRPTEKSLTKDAIIILSVGVGVLGLVVIVLAILTCLICIKRRNLYKESLE